MRGTTNIQSTKQIAVVVGKKCCILHTICTCKQECTASTAAYIQEWTLTHAVWPARASMYMYESINAHMYIHLSRVLSLKTTVWTTENIIYTSHTPQMIQFFLGDIDLSKTNIKQHFKMPEKRTNTRFHVLWGFSSFKLWMADSRSGTSKLICGKGNTPNYFCLWLCAHSSVAAVK